MRWRKRPRSPGSRDYAIDVSKLPTPRIDWAYFFDIDGTLVDIAPTPSEVKLERDLRDLIKRLHELTGGALALISGRSIEDIDSIMHGEKLPVAGQHGVERRRTNGQIARHVVDAAMLAGPRATESRVKMSLALWRSYTTSSGAMQSGQAESGRLPNRFRRPPHRRQPRRLVGRLNDHVATSHSFFRSNDIVHQEFAVHHGDPPVSPPRHLLALLKPVAKEANFLS